MRVSPFTAASATAAFLITIIAGAGQAQTAMDAVTDGRVTRAALAASGLGPRSSRAAGASGRTAAGTPSGQIGSTAGEAAAGETGSSKPSHSALGGTAQRAGNDSNSHADTSGQGSAKANSRNSTNSNGTQGRSNMTN